MRIDFNVLWVEDQQAAVRSTRTRIERLIRRDGFRLQVLFAASVEEAIAHLSDDIYGDHIDLILMDYDLGAGARGDKGLEEVRNIFHFKDVIFYSAGASDLPKMVAAKQLQGIFCSTRDTLHETVQGVFDALMKKVLDIDHSRGIVMGAASDIDHMVNDCLLQSFSQNTEKNRANAMKQVLRHLKEKTISLDKDVKKISALTDVAKLRDFHQTYTSNDRLRLLNSLLESSGFPADKIDIIKDYLKNTVPMRNDLAHVRVTVEGFARRLIDRNGNELTTTDMKALRHALLLFQEFVETLPNEIAAKLAAMEAVV